MREKQDYIRKIDEIRSMMERSSKFASLSGWAGIMAGVYALAGAYLAYALYHFYPDRIEYTDGDLSGAVIIALIVLGLALITAILLSKKKAENKGENIWNATSRRLLANMAVPLTSGGALIIIFIAYGLTGLIIPASLLFYGLALYNAGNFTIGAVKVLGIVQIALGLVSFIFIGYGLLFWAAGFGIAHIAYGIYMYIRYER